MLNSRILFWLLRGAPGAAHTSNHCMGGGGEVDPLQVAAVVERRVRGREGKGVMVGLMAMSTEWPSGHVGLASWRHSAYLWHRREHPYLCFRRGASSSLDHGGHGGGKPCCGACNGSSGWPRRQPACCCCWRRLASSRPECGGWPHVVRSGPQDGNGQSEVVVDRLEAEA